MRKTLMACRPIGVTKRMALATKQSQSAMRRNHRRWRDATEPARGSAPSPHSPTGAGPIRHTRAARVSEADVAGGAEATAAAAHCATPVCRRWWPRWVAAAHRPGSRDGGMEGWGETGEGGGSRMRCSASPPWSRRAISRRRCAASPPGSDGTGPPLQLRSGVATLTDPSSHRLAARHVQSEPIVLRMPPSPTPSPGVRSSHCHHHHLNLPPSTHVQHSNVCRPSLLDILV